MTKGAAKNRLPIFLVIALAIFAVIFGYAAFSPGGAQGYLVELREDGFYPDNLTIQEGDKVIFETTRDTAFWPASNIHPTHGVYPEFDPRGPIEPGGSWQFRFKKAGRWEYHDHLFPLFRGVIAVGEEKESKTSKRGGWGAQIKQALSAKGIAAAFDVTAALYSEEPDFAKSCHSFVHEIGEAAYELFAAGKEMELSPKTSYCGYGFYHGFMETLLLTTGDAKQAREFCEYVDKQLYEKAQGASTACYHGVGHGTVDGSEARYWGNAQAMIEPGFEMCNLVAETDFQLYLCATGVFNSIEILSTDPRYELQELSKDPFSLCRGQEKKFREPCYTNMIPAILRLSNNDVSEAAHYIERSIQYPQDPTINDYTIREMVILSLFHEFIRLHLAEDDHAEKGITLCRSLPEHSRLACFEGLSGGYMKFGKPGEEYKKALAFCQNASLRESERNACYKHLLPRLPNLYSREKSRQICETVEGVYKDRWCGQP